MVFFTNVAIALEALRRSRSRTLLTMLGIIIGVSAVVFILTLGVSIRQAITNQVSSLGNNIVIVRPGTSNQGVLSEKNILHYSPLAPYATTTITEQDYLKLTQNRTISNVAPLMLISGQVGSKQTTSNDAFILASTPALKDTLKLSINAGQFIDSSVNQDTVVIGSQLAIDLYGTDQPIGERLTIRGREHTIIGTLKDTKGPVGINGVDLNNTAIITLDDGKSFNQGIAQIQQLNITPKKGLSEKAAIKSVQQDLNQTHNNQKDFTVMSGYDAAAISRNFYQFMTFLTTVVASISLLVGGVGIMNIMLVGVAERTREIGVRKSLGASNQHILWQFLIEALIMSVVGGTIGLLLGYSAAAVTALLFDLAPIFHWTTLATGFGLSLGVGVLFGLMPAYKAARKNPIEALRQNS